MASAAHPSRVAKIDLGPDIPFTDARKIILAQDNSPRAGGVRSAPRNTRKPASLSEAFPAAEARRVVARFARH
ncbi:MAG: hypothetical protein WBE80_02745 [Methylocella sp.]